MSDEELRRIARNAIPSGVFSGNVRQLRAVYEAGVAAERERAARIAASLVEDFAPYEQQRVGARIAAAIREESL